MLHSSLRKIQFLTLLSIFSYSLQAQVNKSNFKGSLVDEADLPVPGATIMILDPADSTLIQFGSSTPQGTFLIKNIAKGDYLFHVTFLGLQPVYQSVTSGTAEEIDLGKIIMLPSTTMLNTVEVKTNYIPISVDKDTITYNADAFQTQPNAVVEDLLKKLPGIEVGADGTIKAQGEDVQNVLVDGKEFFGSDPKMATKNLPARALKNVKVYDKQSQMSEFTGVDDGIREKTIDLQLREEFKKGLFGTAQAGYGSDSRYNAKASINRFSKTSQVSLLGQFNNINDQGFSFNDRMNFTGGMRGMSGGGGTRNVEIRMTSDVPFSDGASAGLVNTGAGGLNFNWQKNKNFNIRSSYFYNGVDKNLLQTSFRQNLSANPFDTENNTESNTENRSHSFALNSDIQVDSSQQVQISARLGFGNGVGLSESLLRNIVTGNILENQSLTNENNTSDNLSLNTNLNYIKKLGKTGRNISLGGTLSKGDQDNESILQALTEYFSTGETEALDQLQYSTSNDTRMDGLISYTEPLKKRRFMELSYNYNKLDADYNQKVSDVVNSVPVVNPMLSTDFNSIFQYHRPGITFRYSGEINNVNLGLQYQMSELTGQINQNENEVKRTYKHFLPRFSWRSDIGNGKNFRMNYTTRVNQPSITQLSPVIDNSDPLRIYVGNPDLNAEYSHSLSLNFHLFSQFSSTSFFTSLSGTITDDRIITSRNIDTQFREVSSPINIDNETRYSFYASFGRPLKLIHSRFNLNANVSNTSTQNFINTELIDLNRWSRTGGITFSNMNSEVLEYNFGGSWTFTDNSYKDNEDLNQSTLLHNYFVDCTLTLWKKWRVEAGYNYNLYTSNQFAEDQSLPLMKASLSRFLLKGDRGQLKLSIFDVLDENRGLSRSANINYLEELRSNSIGRYAMLSFIYSIKRAGTEPPGSFRVIERRG